MIHWALTAAAVLMLAFAVRVLFSSSKNGNSKREKLGFGFSLVAAGLWIYVLRHHLGELGPAIRIGVGLLLAMPAVSALARPERAQIVRAAGGLVLAVLIAGPVLADLWTEHGPDTRSKAVRQLEVQLEEAEQLRADLVERRTNLRTLEASTRAELKTYGTDWSAIEGNPAALKQLELLAAVAESQQKVEAALGELAARKSRLSEALKTGEPQAQTAPPENELDRLKAQLEAETDSANLGVVEQHLQAQKLRELFDATQSAD